MIKKIKYLIPVAIIIIFFFNSKALAASFSVDINGYLCYNGEKLHLESFENYICKNNNNEATKALLNADIETLLNAPLSYYKEQVGDREFDYLDYRRTLCLSHKAATLQKGEISNYYYVDNVLDIYYGKKDGKDGFVIKANYLAENNKVESKIAMNMVKELAAMIHINDKYSSDYRQTYANEILERAWYTTVTDTGNPNLANARFEDMSFLGDIKTVGTWGYMASSIKEEFDTLYKKYNDFIKMKKVDIKDESGKVITAQENLINDIRIDGNTYTVVGPFSLAFNKDNGVNSIIVDGELVDNDHNNNNNKNNRIYWINEQSSSNNYNDKNKWSSNLTGIESEKIFYLAIRNDLLDSAGEKYNIIFIQKLLSYYKSRILLLRGDRSQQLGIFVGDNSISSAYGEVEYEIAHEVDKRMTIKKLVKNDDNTNSAVEGVKIKVYGKLSDGKEGWVKENGSIASYNEAKEWKTEKNGVINIDKIEDGTYYIYETQTANGYYLDDQRVYYPDSEDPNHFAGKDIYGNCVYLGATDESTEGASGTWKQISISKYQYRPSKLVIEKVDKTNTAIKLSGVKIKVYGKLSDGTEGWVKEDGSITGFSGAKEWITGTDRNGND